MANRLNYKGCAQFRQRVVASTLSGRPLRISDIRSDDESPGLQDFEASFLKLIEKISDGCSIEINESGTSMRYRPGLLVGGKVSHECSCSRGIGWFVEGILALAPFCKAALNLHLTGITNDALDFSTDVLQNVTIPLLAHFGVEGCTLRVKRRGAAPKGGGLVEFYCPVVRELKPFYLLDSGLIKRVRGLGFCTRISPTIITRVVESARGVLNHLLPDVYVNVDHHKGQDGGNSPGYSIALFAESTTGIALSAERTAMSSNGAAGELPEQIGTEAALLLLEEIRRGGVVDSSHQPLVLQLMVLCPEDVCKVRFGELSEASIYTLRLLREVFGVVFKIRADRETNTVLLSCLGTGFKNMARKIK